MKILRKASRAGALMAVLLFPFLLSAQGSIKGNVTDTDTGEPLIGATVIVAGTTSGTITDFDGNFTIESIDAGEYTVEASYTGYSTFKQQVTVTDGAEATVDFGLSSSATDLDLVVVTGTGGPVEKKKIGNTIGTISTKSLVDSPVNSVSDVLAGRSPGVVALPSSGLAGEGAQIRIRGSASLSQLNEPIILLDGIRIDRGGGLTGLVGAGGGGSASRLDDINPESIERIEILKGASAATLFGTEASNGVIQIFTKKGQSGTPKFNIKLAQGVLNFPKGAFADNTGFARNADRASELSAFYGETIRPYQLISRNFTEELFETGSTTQLSADVSGGTTAFNYYVSGRFANTDGPFGGQDRMYPEGISTRAQDTDEMAQLNVNVNILPSEKFNIRITSGYTDRATSTIQNNNNIFATGSLAQFSKPELARENNQTGTIAFMTVNESMQITVDQETKNYSGSVGLNYYPAEWLSVVGIFGLNYSNSNDFEFWPFRYNIDNFAGANPDGFAAYSNRNFTATSAEVRANLDNNISDKLTSSFILGGQLIRQETVIQSGSGQDFPGPGFEVTGAAATEDVFEAFTETVNAGLFAQEQLGFADQFFFTVGGRLDAHSAFGTNFQAQFYPKVSFSYIPSDADWWSPVGPITSLQIRGSYGWAGLQPGAFDALTTYAAIASQGGAGIAPNNLGNEDLSPEVSKEWEAGFTAGLFNNRASLEFTYWDRVVEDALFARQFPLSGGFRGTQLVNIGELSANGIEINLNATVVKNKNVTVEVFANAAYLQEEVVSLGGAPPIKVGGSYPRYRNFLIEGFAPGANFGAKLMEVGPNQIPIDFNSDGNPDTRSEAIEFLNGLTPDDARLPTSVGLGSVLLADDDGDGDLLDHYLGKSQPDWTGSFGGSVKFKNFSLRTLFEYKGGNYVVNNLTDAFRQANASIGRNMPQSARVERDFITGGVDGSFNPQNSGEVRLAAAEEWVNEVLALAPFSGLNTLEKADFVRWRELSLTYQLPKSFIEKFGFRNASITAAGRNIALFTSYSGVDPEIQLIGRGGASDLDQNFGQGIAAFGWPLARQVMFTLKLGL